MAVLVVLHLSFTFMHYVLAGNSGRRYYKIVSTLGSELATFHGGGAFS